MRRRKFLAAIATLAAWPLRAPAQQAKLARIGFLGAATAQGYARQLEGLRAGLQDHGYIEGQNVALEFRWAEGRYDRLSALARELVQQNVDVLVTHGTPGTNALRNATSTIPIVMAVSGDAHLTG